MGVGYLELECKPGENILFRGCVCRFTSADSLSLD
jgi:hypothetical protein